MTGPVGQHDAAAACLCVSDHRPAPMEYESHHVWPRAMGGPDTADNRAWVCPTAHTNIHEVLRLLMRYGRLTLTETRAASDRPVNAYAHKMAVAGYDRWRTASAGIHAR